MEVYFHTGLQPGLITNLQYESQQIDYAFVGICPPKNPPKFYENEPIGPTSRGIIRKVIKEFIGPEALSELCIYYTNLAKEPLAKPEKLRKKDLQTWLPSLIQELKVLKPKRIIVFGTDLAKALCPGFKKLKDDHGTLFYNPDLKARVIPTFPISMAMKDPPKKALVKRDLQRAFTLPDPEIPPYSVLQGIPKSFTPGIRVALDIESTGLNSKVDRITKIGFMPYDSNVVRILDEPTPLQIKQLFESFRKSQCILVGHHFQFDLGFITEKSRFYWDGAVEDTLLMAHIYGEEDSLSLKHLTTMFTDRPGSRSMGTIEDDTYLAEDVLSTKELNEVFHEKLGTDNYALYLVHNLLPLIVGMRNRGVFVNYEIMDQHYPKNCEALQIATQKLNEISGGVNWNANQQVVDVLLNAGIPLTVRTPTGNFSVAEAVLDQLIEEHPEVPLMAALKDYRAATKEHSFYQQYLELSSREDPYLHPRLKLHGTETGRLSCEEPNLQQVPRVGPIKLMFTARWEGGSIGIVDLAQAELRVVALESNDRKFAEELQKGDIHRKNASIAYEMAPEDVDSAKRKKSKGVTFGLLYGGSVPGIARKMDAAQSEIQKLQDVLFSEYPNLKKWMDKLKKQAVTENFVSTLFGRVRQLLNLQLREGKRSVERKGVNTPVQGLASDIMLFILLYVATTLRSMKLKSRPIFNVHDSCLVEIYPGEEDQVARVVQDAFVALERTPLSKKPLYKTLPFTGEFVVGKSWAHCESTNENYDPDNNRVYPCSSLSHKGIF